VIDAIDQSSLEVKPEEQVNEDRKGPYIVQSKVEKTFKEMRLQEMMMYVGMY
jgi:hypothetical protein